MTRKSAFASAATFLLMLASEAQGETIDVMTDRATARMREGRVAEAQALLDSAEEQLKARLEENPEDAEAVCLLGKTYYVMERDSEAMRLFDESIVLAPERPDAHFYKAMLLRLNGDLDGAVREFTAAANADPRRHNVCFELAWTLKMQEKIEDSLAAYRKGLELESTNVKALSDAGTVLMRLGRCDEALELVTRALKGAPDDTDVNYNAGLAYQLLDRHEEALARFLRVVELDADDWLARSKVVQEYAALGRTAERDKAREELLALRRSGRVAELNEAEGYVREQFTLGDKRITVVEYFEQHGEHGVLYAFTAMDKSGVSLVRATYGWDAALDSAMEGSGGVPACGHAFHIDAYCPDGTHRGFDFFQGQPGYDVVRPAIIEVIEGRRRETWSSTPTEKGVNVKISR